MMPVVPQLMQLMRVYVQMLYTCAQSSFLTPIKITG